MDCKMPPSIKTEQPEVYPEYSDVHSPNKETLTEGHIVDKMDSEIPAEVKIEQAEVYVDYPEIHPSSQSCPSIIKQEHSQMEMYQTPDLMLVKQELSDVLCEDKTHTFSEMVDWASGRMFQELARNSNTESAMTDGDYKVLFNLENCSHISENVSPMIEINKNPPLTNENFQLHNMETGFNHTQISRGSLDFTVDSASGICSKIQTPYMSMSNRCDLSVNAEKDIQKVEKLYKQQDCGVAVTETEHQSEENCHNCDDGIASFLQDVQGNKKAHTGLRPFKCDLTSSSFAQNNHLKSLKRTNTEEKCDKYVCEESFTETSSLRKHKIKHTGEKPYKCDVCESSFTRTGHLNTHKRTHTGEKPYKCDVCEASFNHSGNLKHHKTIHTGEKPYKCEVCKSSFTHSNHLKCHKRIHTGEKPYKCDLCESSFTHNGSLKHHKRTHTGEKPYKCDVCEASYAIVGCLVTHKRKHTGEKPYQCDVCGVSFDRVCTLKRHKKKHTGEKPYKCDVCCIYFARVDDMIIHKRKHTGEKPYQCDVCGVSFDRVCNLKRHKKKHTGEKP